jgi:hypothetical protein
MLVITNEQMRTLGPPATCAAQRVHWVEIELHDQDGKAVANEPYAVTLPTGETVRGSLDASGFARFAYFECAGTCKVQFPELDGRDWDFEKSAGRK